MRRGRSGRLAEVRTCGHHGGVADAEATRLMLEALFDIRAKVTEIHEEILGPDDDDEEEEEQEDT